MENCYGERARILPTLPDIVEYITPSFPLQILKISDPTFIFAT